MNYHIFETKKEASEKAFKLFKTLIKEDSTIGLATGGTPTDFYSALIEDYKNGGFSYENIKSYNLDEYVGISYDHPESYHKFMDTHLFDHININKNNVNVPDASAEDLPAAIETYQEQLNNTTIDVQLLGVGSNGHIGFNEPGTPFERGVHVVDLKEETIEANSRFFDGEISKVPKQAVTMGISDIMRAKHIILLAFGENKKYAVEKLVNGLEVTSEIPCTVLKQHPSVHIFVDKYAAFDE